VQLFNKGHATRFPWTGCACCPVNIARFIPSVPGFAYATRGRSVFLGFYLPGTAEIKLEGTAVRLRQTTDYPWDGTIRVEVMEGAGDWEMKLRVPGWAMGRPVPTDLYRLSGVQPPAPTIRVNGKDVAYDVDKGFAGVSRTWSRGDAVELVLPMPVCRVAAHEKVLANTGRTALERGPLVYCVEGADHADGVSQVVLSPDAALTPERRPGLLGGISVLRGTGKALFRDKQGGVGARPVELTAIPYAVWSHRGPNPMAVWLPETETHAAPLPYPTLAGRARVTASHTHSGDTTSAVNDQIVPAKSDDLGLPRFTWWPRTGSAEWIQYNFNKPEKVAAAEVYWFDDEGVGRCRVPQSWRLTYYDGSTWQPVPNASGYGTEKNTFNAVTFGAVTAASIRIEAQLQPEFSGGILEWRLSHDE